MSEVASRFTFFPPDERQSLRIGRFLMAAGTSRARPPGATRSPSARIARR
jgi:hypothetical protein